MYPNEFESISTQLTALGAREDRPGGGGPKVQLGDPKVLQAIFGFAPKIFVFGKEFSLLTWF